MYVVDIVQLINKRIPFIDEVRQEVRGGDRGRSEAHTICNISGVLLKTVSATVLRSLHAILTSVCECGTIPTDYIYKRVASLSGKENETRSTTITSVLLR